MEVYITTYDRPDAQETLRQVPWATLVVQAREYRRYREALPDAPLLVLPDEVRTLGATRRWLVDRHRYDLDRTGKLVLLDDDLTFSYRNVPGDWHLKVATRGQVEELFAAIEAALGNYAHVGVSPREGQNTFPDEPVQNTRYMRVLAYNAHMIPSDVEFGRVDGMSDFDVNLQLLRRGLPSLVFTRWAQGHKSTQAPGGMATQRSLESHSREIDKMLEWHGDFVTAYQKSDKGPMGNRREVRIQWKRAFASSQSPQ